MRRSRAAITKEPPAAFGQHLGADTSPCTSHASAVHRRRMSSRVRTSTSPTAALNNGSVEVGGTVHGEQLSCLWKSDRGSCRLECAESRLHVELLPREIVPRSPNFRPPDIHPLRAGRASSFSTSLGIRPNPGVQPQRRTVLNRERVKVRRQRSRSFCRQRRGRRV